MRYVHLLYSYQYKQCKTQLRSKYRVSSVKANASMKGQACEGEKKNMENAFERVPLPCPGSVYIRTRAITLLEPKDPEDRTVLD